MMKEDRSAAALLAIARAADPRRLYRGFFAGRVVSQSEDLASVDVKPDDPTLPGASGVPLRLPIAGMRVRLRIARGATPSATATAEVRVLIGFENGDPTREYALLVEAPAASLDLVTLAATNTVELGAAGATEALVLGGTYRAAEHTLNAGPLGMAAAFDLMQAAAVGPLAPLKPGLLQAKAALEAFEAQAAEYLSGKVRTV